LSIIPSEILGRSDLYQRMASAWPWFAHGLGVDGPVAVGAQNCVQEGQRRASGNGGEAAERVWGRVRKPDFILRTAKNDREDSAFSRVIPEGCQRLAPGSRGDPGFPMTARSATPEGSQRRLRPLRGRNAR
jgi:hypothetical protein